MREGCHSICIGSIKPFYRATEHNGISAAKDKHGVVPKPALSKKHRLHGPASNPNTFTMTHMNDIATMVPNLYTCLLVTDVRNLLCIWSVDRRLTNIIKMLFLYF